MHDLDDIILFFCLRARDDVADGNEWDRHQIKMQEELRRRNLPPDDPALVPVALKRRDGRAQEIFGAKPICYSADLTTLWWYLLPREHGALILKEVDECPFESSSTDGDQNGLRQITITYRIWEQESGGFRYWKRLSDQKVVRLIDAAGHLVAEK